MAGETFSFTISLQDFDVSLLPDHARQRGTPEFSEEVNKFLQRQFADFGGTARILVDQEKAEVTWTPAGGRIDPVDLVVKKLERGELKESLVLLELLRSGHPDDPRILYNLGMVYSDLGRLDVAEATLRRTLEVAPKLANAYVALGVALVRGGRTEEAVRTLEEALKLQPDNSYALRNLGACLMKLGRTEDAEHWLQKAVELNPDDQQALFGLAQALSLNGKMKEADETLIRTIKANEHTNIAEMARQARSKLAQSGFRAKAGGIERMDAVMYCLGALQKFEAMPKQEVQKIGFEIAMLGMKGLDVNDPTQKYRLKSLPGSYSGLHLVSLMYVAFKIIDPQQDVGFDLSKEYEIARQLQGNNQG